MSESAGPVYVIAPELYVNEPKPPASVTEILPVIIASEIPNVPELAVKFVPAIAVTKSATLSFLELLSPPSIIAKLSAVTSTAAAVNSFRSNAKVTVPDVPPPLKPFPAVTPSISPASLVKLITPVELLYETSPLALNNPLMSAFATSMSLALTVIPYPPTAFTVTSPDVPPPVKPAPATTLSISPASLVKLITPVELLYAKSPETLIAALASESAY